MSWWRERRVYPSTVNGELVVERFLGRWRLLVDGGLQSGDVLDGMWKNALKDAPKTVKRVLVLGLGMGGVLCVLQRRYPAATIVVIDWDPALVTIAKELGPKVDWSRVEVKIGEAVEALKDVKGVFDLVLVDLFDGKGPIGRIAEPVFLEALDRVLTLRSVVLVNGYKEKELLEKMKTGLAMEMIRRRSYALVGVFRKSGAGVEGDRLPEGYAPYRGNAGYLSRQGRTERMYTHWGDEEPVVPKGRLTLVMWQRATRTTRPKGWLPFLFVYPRLIGLGRVRADWESTWAELARRQLKMWRSQSMWKVVAVTWEQFVAGYRASCPKLSIRTAFEEEIPRLKEKHGERVQLMGVVPIGKPDATPVAGFVWLDIPEVKQSYHVTSYFDRTMTDTPLTIGLMEAWYQHAVEKEIDWLDFGAFWTKGEPKTWKGFSRFKGLFVTWFVRYPRTLVKIVW